jgi:excisionase family DNA binding protein
MNHVTVKVAAVRLGVNEKTIRKWLAERRLPYLKLGKAQTSSVRIPEKAIEKLIRESTIPALDRPDSGLEEALSQIRPCR